MDRTLQKGPSQRQLKVGEEVRHLISDILIREDFHDPLLSQGKASITEVRMSPDLKHARAFVLPLGAENCKEFVQALNDHAREIRHCLSKMMTLRYLPKIFFVEDKAFFQASHIEKIFNSTHVKQDLLKHSDDSEGHA